VRPEDELALRIQQYVAANVPPDQVVIVTRTVCLTVSMLMAEPGFTNELAIVRSLRDENTYLKTQYAILKQMLSGAPTSSSRSTKSAAKPRKRAPAKKTAGGTRRTSAPTVKGGTAAQRAAFRSGYGGTS
jgi:hypothetical protein